MSNLIAIMRAVRAEREYQDRKWGKSPHEVGAWLLILQRELQEAIEAWTDYPGDTEALREILQVIAAGCACLQQHGVIERQKLDATFRFKGEFTHPSVAEALFGEDTMPEGRLNVGD